MAPIGEMSDDRLQKVYALNVFGPAYAMRKAVNVFLAQESGGSIINVASLGCVKVVAGPVYCSSKAALVSMSKNTAFMYMPQKIRVNVIAPGGIATEISSSMGMPNMGGYARVQKVLAAAPEVGKAEDVAAAALFFASDDSSYISGDVMYVDGGWNAG
jgi:NAD(P)-dependent dehydrogenase (short-subunit alcohol dehydrogenase family)